MNPVFLMVNDLPQVIAAIQLDKLEAVQKAHEKSAAKELAKASKELLQKIKDLNDGYQ